MALWICDGCGCAYSVGADKCPNCGESAYTPDYATPSAALADAKPLAVGGVISADQPVVVVRDETPPLVLPSSAKASE